MSAQAFQKYPKSADAVMALPVIPLDMEPEKFLLRSTAPDACWLATDLARDEVWAPCFAEGKWWRKQVNL